jgi:hypothetical protein
MGKDPKSSVTDPYGQSHDVPNLFVHDAGIFVTAGNQNPTLTILALATAGQRAGFGWSGGSGGRCKAAKAAPDGQVPA